MANKAISELPEALNVNNQDLFVLEQGGLAKKLAAETFITEQGIIDALAEALDGHGGIQSVTLSSVSGRIRTYLITFTDQSATTFQVYDGTSIDRITKTSTAGLVDTYTVFMNDGTTSFFQVRNGQDGSATWDQINSKAPIITDTVTGAIVNFSDGADDIPVADLVVNIEPKQSGSGNPSPSNIRPITGWTGANVWDDPKHGGAIDWNQLIVNGNFADGTDNWLVTNHLSMSASNNKLTATAVSKSTYAYIHQDNLPNIPTGHKVLISLYVTLSQAETIAIGNGTGIIATSSTLTANTRTQYWTVTTISSTPLAKLFIYTGRTAGLDVDGTCTIEDVQVYDLTRIYGAGNEPTTFSSFSALFPNEFYDYNSGTVTCASAVNGDIYKQIQIDWTAEAGTVYGGSLDVTTGVLTVTDGYIASYAGETLPSTWISDRDVYAPGTTPTTGAEVVYKLDAQQTYQLAPHEVRTLLGRNNIFSDCSSVEVEYRADTKIYIEKDQLRQDNNLAYVESSSSASRAYATNDFFVNRDGLLCKVTATISSGGTLVEGTNYTILSGNGGLGAEVTSCEVALNGKEDAGWLTGMGFSRTDVSGGGNVTIKDYTIFLAKLITVSGANIQSLVNAHYKVTFYLKNSNGGSFSLSGNCAGNTYNLSADSSGLVSGTYEGNVSANGTIYNGLVSGSVGSGSIFAATVLVKF